MGEETNRHLRSEKAALASGVQQNGTAGEVSAMRSCYGAVVPHKPPVEVGKAIEALQLLAVGGSGPVRDSRDFGGIHLELPLRYDETEKGSSGAMKLIFLGFDKQLVLQESLQHCADMILMILERAGVDKNIIQINKHKPA